MQATLPIILMQPTLSPPRSKEPGEVSPETPLLNAAPYTEESLG